MRSRRIAPVVTVAAIAGCLLAPLAGRTQDLYGCERPAGMPPVPNGLTATLDEMQVARESVELYLDEGEAFVTCLSQYPDSPVAATLRNQVISEMDVVVVRFNSALCAYSDGTQCARAPSPADPQSSGLAVAPGDSTAMTGSVDHYGTDAQWGDDSAEYSAPTPWETGRTAPAGDDPDAWPDRARTGVAAREPSLPDGTPCGSVTQTRNETTGEGLSLRGRYQWEIYNACIDPIVIRWTVAGDGMLDSRRTIAGRSSLGFGCSTRPGRVSTRRCTGELQYLFEWP